MAPPTYNLDPVHENDTWAGIGSITIEVDGNPPAVAAASAQMRFARQRDHSNTLLTLSSAGDDPGITITDAVNWIFAVLPRTPIGLPPGTYTYAFKVTDADGTVQTYLEGQIVVTAEV